MRNRTSEHGALSHPEAGPVCSVLVTRLGGSHSRVFGINLAGMEADETFKWFAAALLIGSPIPSSAALGAYRELERRVMLTPRGLSECSEDDLAGVLAGSGAGSYWGRVASLVRSVSRSLVDEYESDINRLHFFADDSDDLIDRLRSLGGGVPRRTVGLFLREMKGVWDKAHPRLSPGAIEAARRLGLADCNGSGHTSETLHEVWERASGAGRTYADFEVALVRLGENYCSAGKCIACPMKKLCIARRTDESESVVMLEDELVIRQPGVSRGEARRTVQTDG